MLTLLHTSDWHLGRKLYTKPRYEEFRAFLQWQIDVIYQQNVDILLIAGDIFDTTSPSNQAQSLYFDFLSDLIKSPCRHVVIVAGNHDSPSFLDAPKVLLKNLDIHIIGCVSENLDDEVLVLNDKNGQAEAIITAVPYLRDRDVRQVGSSESLSDKEMQLVKGIYTHYDQVSKQAFAKKDELEQQLNKTIPVIATGHLFMVGGQTLEDDGVRELYVGSLGSVGIDMFDSRYDYVGLGHLHVPQAVGNQEFIRYSGSPIAMGFGEANQQKQVNLVRFFADTSLLEQPILPLKKQLSDTNDLNIYNLATDNTTVLQSLPIPVFQSLVSVKGDLTHIKTQLNNLVQLNQKIWVEVSYQGDSFVSDLREQVNAIVENSEVEILRIQNTQAKNQTLIATDSDETLETMDVIDVFERCMTSHQVEEADKQMLLAKYAEVVESLREND